MRFLTKGWLHPVVMLALMWCVALPTAWAADSLQLDDNTKLEGLILEEDDAVVVIQVGNERKEVERARILKINRQKITYPPLPESPWTCVGPGGGGAMYIPTLSPVDPNLGMIGCDMGGTYLTRDRGRSWTLLPVAQVGRYPQGLAFSSKNPRVMFVGASPLTRSADGGATWKAVTADRQYPMCVVMSVLVDPENDKLVWASFGKGGEAGQQVGGGNQLLIERSIDGGLTFVNAAEGLPKEGGLVRHVAVDINSPVAQRTLYAATTRGLFVSKDGGATWKRGGQGLGKDDVRHVVTMCDKKTKKTVVLVSTEPSGVYRSDDGESFTAVQGIPADAVVESLAASAASATNGWAAGADIWKTTDGGKTWKAVFDESTKLAGWLSTFCPWQQRQCRGLGCDPDNPDRAWFTGDMQLWSTSDGGATFTELNCHPIPEKTRRVAFRSQADLGRHGLVGKGPLNFSGGGLEVTFVYQVCPDPVKKGRFFSCCADIGTFRSEDNGESWIYNSGVWNVGIKSEWRNSCYEYAFHPKIAGQVWAAFTGRHNLPEDDLSGNNREIGGVAISSDAGATWQPCENAGLPDKPVTSICLDRRLQLATLYAAVYGTGVFVSRDGGKKWESMSEGLPGEVRAWRLRQGPDDVLYLICARGKPGGVWRYDEAARQWRRLDTQPAFADVRDLLVGRDAKKDAGVVAVAVSGQDGGVYVSNDAGTSWKRIFDQPATSIDCTADYKTWFATGAGLWRSTNGGGEWTKLEFPFAQLNDVTFDPNDAKTIWIGSAGGGIFKGPISGIPVVNPGKKSGK